MGFRFRKSMKLGPFRVTLSKSGISYSAGVKGLRVTKTASGAVRTTASIPGTGISYVKETSGKSQHTAAPSEKAPAQPPAPSPVKRYDGPLPAFPAGYDEIIEDAARLVIGRGFATIPMLQHELNLGYTRAARLLDQLEELGIVGPYSGANPREIVYKPL